MYFDLDGTTLLILIVLILIVVETVRAKQGRSKRYQYDERQELVRGRGFQYGFFAMAACLILEAAYGDWLGQFVGRDMRTILCLCIGILADTVYVIWHDGYFPVNEHPLTVILGLTVLFGMNLLNTILFIRKGMFIQNGELLGGAGYLIWAVILLIELLAVLFRYLWRKREEED